MTASGDRTVAADQALAALAAAAGLRTCRWAVDDAGSRVAWCDQRAGTVGVHPDLLTAPEAALAGVLAHEVAHLAGGHAAVAVRAARLRLLLVLVAATTAPLVTGLADAGAVAAAVLLPAVVVAGRRQLRGQELAADARAADLLAAAGLVEGAPQARAAVALGLRWCTARSCCPWPERLDPTRGPLLRTVAALARRASPLLATHPPLADRLAALSRPSRPRVTASRPPSWGSSS